MSRKSFVLLSLMLILNAVHAEEASSEVTAQNPSLPSEHRKGVVSDQHVVETLSSDKHQSEVPSSDKQQLEALSSDHQQQEVLHSEKHHLSQTQAEEKHSEMQHSKTHHTEKLESEVQQGNKQQHEEQKYDNQHNEAQQPQVHHTRKQYSASQDSSNLMVSSRQFHPPPYYPMFQQPTGFEAIRRQFGGGLGSDLMMVGLIGLPILGLLTMGSASIGSLLGLGASSSSSKKSSSKRSKRSLKEKAADAVEYAKKLWNVMEQLEKAFEKYDLYQAECRLRVVCEAHHKDRRMGSWGQSILDLMR